MKDENKDLVSIILPCYNAEKYIEKCIKSIIDQTYKNIELIIVDDGSTDNTLKILNKYKENNKKIKIIEKANTGVSDSRNVGIQAANGKYIMFIDADDFYEKDAVEILYDALIKNNVNVARARYKRIDNNRIIEESKISKFNDFNIEDIIYNILKGNISCYVWVLIINRQTLEKHKIKFNNDLKIMEDTLFYIQLIKKEKIYFLDKIIYNYVENSSSATRNIKKTLITYKEMLRAEEKIIDELENNNLWNERFKNVIIEKMIINGISNCTWNLYKSKNKQLLKEYLNYIVKNEKIQNAISVASMKNIRIDKVIIIGLIKKRWFNVLNIVYKMKYLIYKITKRKND